MKPSVILPQTVNFHNQTLLTLQKDGIAYVAMKPICENIGLDWTAQRQRLMRDEVLNSTMVMITTVGNDGKNREMLCLPIHSKNIQPPPLYKVGFLLYDTLTTKKTSGIKSRPERAYFLCLFYPKLIQKFKIKNHSKRLMTG